MMRVLEIRTSEVHFSPQNRFFFIKTITNCTPSSHIRKNKLNASCRNPSVLLALKRRLKILDVPCLELVRLVRTKQVKRVEGFFYNYLQPSTLRVASIHMRQSFK